MQRISRRDARCDVRRDRRRHDATRRLCTKVMARKYHVEMARRRAVALYGRVNYGRRDAACRN